MRKFWLKKAISALDSQENVEDSKDKDSFGSIVFPTTYKTRQKIISLYLQFFEDMKDLVLEDKADPEIIQVLSFQLFNPKNTI